METIKVMNEPQHLLLNSLKLPKINTLDELSNNLRISKKLIYLLSKNNDSFYKEKTIKKKNGDDRNLLVPSYSLKLIQKWILTNILEKIEPSEESMAFKKGELFNTKSNANHHRYNIYLLKMDFKDFFPSIKKNRIYCLFTNLGYNTLIATILTNICTHKGSLPQGAITSPYLSNLVCYELDYDIKNKCEELEITYTRYADDLIFSCDNMTRLKNLHRDVIKITKKHKFKLNREKTKYRSENRKKTITGITINQGQLKACKKLKINLRSIIYNSIRDNKQENLNKIIGYISYIKYIEPYYDKKMLNYIKKVIEKIYFKYFDPKEISKFQDLIGLETMPFKKIMLILKHLYSLPLDEYIELRHQDELYVEHIEEDIFTFRGK